jgi:predicted aspartyl protease
MKAYEFRYRLLHKIYFPIVPVLMKGRKREWVPADELLDSGAVMSLFQADIGRELGLELTKGERIYPRGIGGHIRAYVHRVLMKIGEEEFEADVAYSEELPLGVNILGRKGVFDRFLVKFDEKNKKVQLERI